MPYRNIIKAAYDAGVEEELSRLIGNPTGEAEFDLITSLIDVFIPNGSVVIDIGSGPGRYAEHLLKRYCKVGVVDLSARSLKAFSDRMTGACCIENIIFNQVSCATRLDWIADNSADTILLMGPLYHIINEEHRKNALSHCRRILKPEGYLFSVFLSPYHIVNLLDKNEYLTIKSSFDQKVNFKGLITHTTFQGYSVPQFRCWPNEAEILMNLNNFKVVNIKNIDNKNSSTSNENDLNVVTHQYLCISQCIKN